MCNAQGEPLEQVDGPEKLSHSGVLIGEAASLSTAPRSINPCVALSSTLEAAPGKGVFAQPLEKVIDKLTFPENRESWGVTNAIISWSWPPICCNAMRAFAAPLIYGEPLGSLVVLIFEYSSRSLVDLSTARVRAFYHRKHGQARAFRSPE